MRTPFANGGLLRRLIGHRVGILPILRRLMGPDGAQRHHREERNNRGRSDWDGLSAAEDRDRAQTTVDFMIGASVFLLTVAVVFGIIPGIIDPFNESQENTLVADRLAAQVSGGMLADTGTPSGLNQTCVNAFFNSSLGNGGGCPIPFNESVTDLPDRLGVDDRHRVNISIQRDVDADGELDVLSTTGGEVGTSGHTKLAIGPDVPPAQSVVVGSRAASLGDKDVIVVVKVW